MFGRLWLAGAFLLALVAPASAAEIILYTSPDYQGESLRVQGDIPSLRSYGMNDKVSSFVVVSGEWGLYEDRDYGGRGIRAIRGSFPNMEAAGFKNNELSSLRVLTPAPPPPKKLPDLVRKVVAQSGYDARLEGGVARDVRFRGLTVLVEVANQGDGAAGPSTARIELSPHMTLAPAYVGMGVHHCRKREVPSSTRPGGPAECIRLHASDVIASPAGDGLNCAIPALGPGEVARCVGVLSVAYSWMVPSFDQWIIVVRADAARKVRETDEKNNGEGQQLEFRADDLPPPT